MSRNTARPGPAEDPASQMREDWDRRARENARYYVHTGKQDWTDEEFFATGEANVRDQILNDMTNICQGKPPSEMKVLEIGCGAARITRALAARFGEVHAVDISGEMVRLAREALAAFPNAFIYQNNGADLSVIPGESLFDFAFSYIVFQHIPSREIVENYVREVYRLLRPGALFKFQVQGGVESWQHTEGTWVGVAFSDEDMIAMASRCGFERRYSYGADGQFFWNWFFKK